MHNMNEVAQRVLVKPAEAAAILGVRTATLANWASLGKIQSVLLPSGHRRYYQDEIHTMRGDA